ncbi:putative transmembrane protein [Heterostelium album PN500]|uniref:Putative transmembrane protein n=1 Tax=Heterostelium pallidum (strain ATCC 26659 / Pp 5 / PN500) TaxID=670386 RepID=D3B0P3_HETP5|nr:putative transmembrane protein [Heterostelium album PN500]EFA84867.1 putative transmembrane protein [Heterostelium album PN500]|eukprot:XP_020436978.1 putative transmembrane protein [Heterostelium album PN500]
MNTDNNNLQKEPKIDIDNGAISKDNEAHHSMNIILSERMTSGTRSRSNSHTEVDTHPRHRPRSGSQVDLESPTAPITPRNKMVEITAADLSNSSSKESDDNEEDDDDDMDDDVNPDADTVKNEKGAAEMLELSTDPDSLKKQASQSKKMNRRRLQLSLLGHSLELTLEYGKIMFIVLITTVLGIAVIYGFSQENWIKKDNGTVEYFEKKSVTMLTSLFFILGLALFTGVQFMSVFGFKRMFETKFHVYVIGAIGLFLMVPWGMFAGDESYWFWLGDVLLLVVGYCGLCFVMGFLGKKYQTTRERLNNGLAFLGTETLVSATALLYGMFFIQIYANFSNYAKIAWRLIVHPIYFEIFMMIPVRLLVTKQMEKKGVSIMHSLAVVHAQAHISTLGRMMISTINEIEFTIISVFLLNIGKLVFRSSVQIRDKYASKVFEKVMGAEHKESKKFVRAVGLYTEMIMENASIPTSAFTMWVFYNFRGLFFFPFPDGGSFTLGEAVINAVIQLALAVPFDILTLIINERYFGLPLERAWKKMREKWLPFFGFLIYGVITMGMIGVIWMACRLPRFITCKSEDVCSCMFVSNCENFIKDNLS